MGISQLKQTNKKHQRSYLTPVSNLHWCQPFESEGAHYLLDTWIISLGFNYVIATTDRFILEEKICKSFFRNTSGQKWENASAA